MLSHAAPTTSVRNQRIKIAITIMGFAVAGIVLAANLRSPPPVEADERKPVVLLCPRCDRHFIVGFEEFAKAAGAVSDVEIKTAAGTGRRRSLQERAVAMTCPSCGQMSGKPASHCRRHDLYYLKHTAKGANARCPKCSPVPGAAS
ncbi:MAG TPA: hypothetical protein VJZ71_00120 [Phycisphaerae bacterium]|nr:hypothetical protein [Phycisphaerae bacterium]